MGDSHGGKWKPSKKEDERFFGEPGEIKTIYIQGKKGGYRIDTKIGEDGRAISERHYTDHDFPKHHSNPHDHIFSWDPDTGFPDLNTNRVNYFDGIVPEFKSKGIYYMNNNHYNDDYSFRSISDFKQIVKRGAEIEFVWKDVIYWITPENNKKIAVYEANNEKTYIEHDTVEEVLLYKLATGETLRDVILQAEISSRTL